MKTFQEVYCEACRCPEQDFERRVFWRCLPPHAWPLAPFVAVMMRNYFEVDREFIALAGRARTSAQLQSEIQDYVMDHRNRSWWRRRAHVRVSVRRLRRLVHAHLGGGTGSAARPGVAR